ncbi:uncharacterized protein LOC122504547 [Leptopilina heterotoma]|uniref:uncharacterized protein LOC122504547 n=1 Tax=Leptopilina heterotoma TaxID=63436 RepID=UPI001CA89DE5|nr:uncharacterized protein LOC122504547 [Leptopilina heterotoma]
MDQREYAVVHFLNEGTVEVIPTKWLDQPDVLETEAFWPPEKGWPLKGSRYIQLKKAVQGLNDPDITWPVFNVKVLHLFQTYEDAIQGCKKAEYDSNIDTEKEVKSRKRRKPLRYVSSDLDSENDTCADDNICSPTRKLKPKIKKIKKIQSNSDSDDVVLQPPKVSDHLKGTLLSLNRSTLEVCQNNNKSPKTNTALKKTSGPTKMLTSNSNKGKEKANPSKNIKKIDISSAKARALSNSKNSKSATQNLPSDLNNNNGNKTSKTINMNIENKTNKKHPISGKLEKYVRVDSVLDKNPPNIMETDDVVEPSASSTSPFKVTPTASTSGINNDYSNLSLSEYCGNIVNLGSKNDISAVDGPSNQISKNSLNPQKSVSTKAAKDKEEAKLTSTLLIQVSKQLDAVLLNQAIIMRAVDPNIAKMVRPEQMPTMPMRVMADFNKMEKFLQEPINFAAIRDRLWMLSTGSQNEKSATGKILSHMMYNCLAANISWKGSSGSKIEFQTSKSCEVVFSAIGLRFKGSNLDDAEAKMKDWFRSAPYKKQEDGLA